LSALFLCISDLHHLRARASVCCLTGLAIDFTSALPEQARHIFCHARLAMTRLVGCIKALIGSPARSRWQQHSQTRLLHGIYCNRTDMSLLSTAKAEHLYKSRLRVASMYLHQPPRASHGVFQQRQSYPRFALCRRVTRPPECQAVFSTKKRGISCKATFTRAFQECRSPCPCELYAATAALERSTPALCCFLFLFLSSSAVRHVVWLQAPFS
jgi:hypothetical protein